MSYFSSTTDILFQDSPEKKINSIESDVDDVVDGQGHSQTYLHAHQPQQQQPQPQKSVPDSTDTLLYQLNLWYTTHHRGISLKDSFATEMVFRGELPTQQGSEIDEDNKNNYNDDDLVVVTEDSNSSTTNEGKANYEQLWTATFTCPIDKEMVVDAGQIPGFVRFRDKNYYSKKKLAMQATAKDVLALKTPVGSDNGVIDDEIQEDDHFGIVGETGTRSSLHCKDGTTVDSDRPSIVQDVDGNIHPANRLGSLYRKHFNVTSRSKQFQVVKQDFAGTLHGGFWWTAFFTCPVDGRVYTPTSSSAMTTAGGSVPAEDRARMCFKSGDQENGVESMWFRRKSDALHSAAAAAIEAIDWENMDRRRVAKMQQIEKLLLEESVRLLASWYSTKHGINDLSNTDDYFIATHADFKGRFGAKRWTASFICPVSGERFDSGTLDKYGITTDKEGVLWYSQQYTAVRAAALRAYDLVKYRETGQLDPRFCQEHPYQIPPPSHSILRSRVNDDYSDGDCNVDVASSIDDLEGGFDDDDDGHDEYIIEVIPQSHGLDQNIGNGNTANTPLDIIAQAWIESTRPESDLHIERSNSEANRERQKAVERALNWISQWDNQINHQKTDRTLFNLKGQIWSLKIANLMLSSLAEAHQRLPFQTEPAGVELAATAILDRMWSSFSSAPDSLTYASYLLCLEGENCEMLAKKAQEIVKAMEEGSVLEGRVLPRPSVDVYSSLAKLKSQAGIKSLDELRPIIDPNRDLYLAELSSMAHDSSTFDAEYALKCIHEIRALAGTKLESLTQPNIEVFNAPLRWSGGELSSRSYTRPVPWDAYNDIFRFGFNDWNDDDSEVKEAREMEKWIEMMTMTIGDYSDVPRNIETYESIIQAWVRSGNLEGLRRAEGYAMKLCNGDYFGIEPRVHTFYPILSAWTYSGAIEGPNNVQSWIKRLKKISLDWNSFPSFSRLLMLSEGAVQKQLLRDSKGEMGGVKKVEKRLFNSAIHCDQLLQKLLLQHKLGNDTRPVPLDLFLLAIQAWNNAAGSVSCRRTTVELEHCVEGTERTVNAFEELLLFLSMSSIPSHRSQLASLIDHAPALYGAHLATIKSLNKKANHMNSEENSLLNIQLHLSHIEKLVRRSEEYRLFVVNNLGLDRAETSLERCKRDSFPFASDTLLEIPILDGWLDCICLALDVIEDHYDAVARNESYFIRLCLLIARTLETSHEQSSIEKTNRLKNRVINLLEKFKNENMIDRKVLIDRVIQALDGGNLSAVGRHDTDSLRNSNTINIDGEGYQRENFGQRGIVRNNTNARRKRVRGSDNRSQQLRKVPHRIPRRRPRVYQ
jgi:hypothetical protein